MATKSTPQTQRATDAQGRSQVLRGEPKTQRQPVEVTNSDGRCELRVTYVPREDATPEGEGAALANVYRFLLDRRERRDDGLAADGAEERAEHGE